MVLLGMGMTLIFGLTPRLMADSYNQNLKLISGANVGKPYKVCLAGNYAYVAAIQSFLIYDISVPTSPRLIGHYNFYPGEESLDLAVRGSYAYLAQKYQGFWVIDISDPTRPRMVKEYLYENNPDSDLRDGWVFGLSLSGNYIYLADDNGGLRIVDISDPHNPEHVAAYSVEWMRDVVCVNNTAYLASQWDGLICVDVSSKYNPEKIGEVDLSANTHTGRFEGLEVKNNYAYLVSAAKKKDLSTNDLIGNPGLRIIDISNPTAPSKVSSLTTTPEGIIDVTIDDKGKYAYMASVLAGLIIVDIRDKTNPRIVGTFPTPGAAQGVAVRDHYAYIADHYRGLRVIDITDPANLVEAGFCEAPISSRQFKLASTGPYAFVIDSIDDKNIAVPQIDITASLLRVLDIRNPAEPNLIATCPLTGTAKDLVLHGNYAHIAAGKAGISTFDISDPSDPKAIPLNTELGATVDLLGVKDNYIVTSAYGDPLKIFDYSNPAAPLVVNNADTKVVTAFDIAGDYLFVAERGAGQKKGVHIFKIDPSAFHLQPTGVFESTDTINEIKNQGDRLYLLCRNSSQSLIRAVDISDPRNPREISAYGLTSAAAITIADHQLVYAAGGNGDLRILNFSNLYHPAEKGYLSFWGSFTAIDWQKNNIYATNGYLGFMVFDYQPVIPPNLDKEYTFARPNPFIPSRSTTTFTLPANRAATHYTIRIINLKGHLIRTLVNEYEWDGRDQQGNLCESGVYLYQITLPGQNNQHLTGKVVLMR